MLRGPGGAAGACFALLSPPWRGAASRCELQSRGDTGPVAVSDLSSSSSFQKHEFFVDMTCEGCSSAVTRVLNKLGGVQFDIDLPNKKVCIESEHNIDTLLETLKKTGKTTNYLGEK
ncbi:PREDICTED: copper transport protein ATOX1 [Crocodylus porosus]|nr:PREDICTED: copper transport protein ATOX1 [Crocodylus porosus]